MTTRISRRSLRRGAAVLAMVAAIATAGCGGHRDTGSQSVAEGPVRLVTVEHPLLQQWPVGVPVEGEIRSREVSVAALLGGAPLISVDKDVGDVVRQGEILARIAPRFIDNEIAQRQALLAEEQANLGQSQLTLDKSRELAEAGAISGQDLLHYRTEIKINVAKVELARAQLALSEMRGEAAVIRSPIDGVVSARGATLGKAPAVGEELFRLVGKRDCELAAKVDMRELGYLSVGKAISFVSSDGATIAARVRAIAPTATSDRFTALVYLVMPGECHFLPGTYVAGNVVYDRSAALSVERSAVFEHDGFQYVMTVDSRDRVHRVKVTTGRTQQDRVEIFSGLAPRDLVIDGGGNLLDDETAVRVTGAPASVAATARTSSPVRNP
jgi:HlyD family secretion protein